MTSHIFTVDVEYWYHGFSDSEVSSADLSCRLEKNLRRILCILQEKNVLATFFWVGSVAEQHKRILREISDLGHDTGCHGWSHTHLCRLGKRGFQNETRRAVSTLSDITGKRVIHYRAPYFSISQGTPWALPFLAEQGIEFDSSIVPVRYWRYGYPGFESGISHQRTVTGVVTEVPVSTTRILGIRIPFAGGAWFRILPFRFVCNAFQQLEDRNSAGVFYIHPWELDPDHPRIIADPRVVLPHYMNLSGTSEKLVRLLDRFNFTSISQFFSCRNNQQSKGGDS